MKKLFNIILLLPFFLFSCSLFTTDVSGFLAANLNPVKIEGYSLDGEYPLFNGIAHIPSGTDRDIEFSLVNAEYFELDFTVLWDNNLLDETLPEVESDYFLTQQNNFMVMTLAEEFLKKLDTNPSCGDIEVTINVAEKNQKEVLDSYTCTFMINTIPTIPENVTLVKNPSYPHWILAFDVSNFEERKGVQSDINKVCINDVCYDLLIDAETGVLSCVDTTCITLTPPSDATGKELTLINGNNEVYNYKDGDTVFFLTGISTAESPNYTLSVSDVKGAVSDSITVNTTGIIQTEYYVSQDGDDVNTGTENLPYKTLQKAIDTILTTGDKNITYTVLLNGAVGSVSIDADNTNSRSIILKGDSSDGEITSLTLEGDGVSITLEENISADIITVSNSAALTIDGAAVSTLAIASSDTSLLLKQKPLSPIAIELSNIAHKSLLIKNDGASFSDSDFVFTGNSGSLYISAGDLYYSSYNDVLWSTITLDEVTVSPSVAGIPAISINKDFTISPNSILVEFDLSDTTEAQKSVAVKAAFAKALNSNAYENIKTIEAEDITVGLESSFVEVALKAEDGYVFDYVDFNTSKVLRFTIEGDFNSYVKIDWTDVSMEKPSFSNAEIIGEWAFLDGEFTGDINNSTIKVPTSVTKENIDAAILGSITALNTEVYLKSDISSGDYIATLTLKAKSGFVFEDGTFEKTIVVAVKHIYVYSINIDINGGRPGTETFVPYTVDENTEIEQPLKSSPPYQSVYNFAGWSVEKDGEAVSFPYTVTSDTLFYAVWE